jgi:hypothetical protein
MDYTTMYRNINSFVIYTFTLICVRWSLYNEYYQVGTFALTNYANYGYNVRKSSAFCIGNLPIKI